MVFADSAVGTTAITMKSADSIDSSWELYSINYAAFDFESNTAIEPAADDVFVVNGIVIKDFDELRERLAFSAALNSDGSRNHFLFTDGTLAMLTRYWVSDCFIAVRVSWDLCWVSGPNCLRNCICLLWPGSYCPYYQAAPFCASQIPCVKGL